jgi:hypothetical protein
MDAVAEVKVLLNNYQAEYGKGSGGIGNIVSKGGTEDFHGSAYYYARDEKLNANDFFENAAGNSRERYRYNTVGGTFGGPLRLPGLGKKGADKLFPDHRSPEGSWDQSGVQINPAFGKVTSARDPRIMPLALQLRF